jgi:F-type H+-transporting ATPase subunit b
MTIDWITILFQIINFLILVFLLRRFLYRPIIESMEKREETILDREAKTHLEKEQANVLSKDYENRIQTFEQDKDKLFKEIHQQVKEQKHEMMEQTKRDVASMQSQWQREVEKEASMFMGQLKEMISKEACSLAKQVLKDMASKSLETMVFEVFLTKFDQLSDSENKKMIDALQHDKKATLISAFEITQDQLDVIDKKLSTWTSSPPPLHHEIDPALICGFILEVEGYQVMFNINHYLDAIEKRIIERLTQSIKGSDEHEE